MEVLLATLKVLPGGLLSDAVKIGVVDDRFCDDRAWRRGLSSGWAFLMVTPCRGGGGLFGAVTGDRPPPPVLQGSRSSSFLSVSSPRIVFSVVCR